jgi:glycosidase
MARCFPAAGARLFPAVFITSRRHNHPALLQMSLSHSHLPGLELDPDSWWRRAVIYQIYLKSFADANGDGFGDLRGAAQRLDYIQRLGVDAVWLCPFYTSPNNDGGYDVSDHRDVDPMYGSLADAEEFILKAHARNIKVIIDLVPNHSSVCHPLFQAALATPPGSAEWSRYHCVRGRGAGGHLPPNNWQSFFGGPAWSPVPWPEARRTPQVSNIEQQVAAGMQQPARADSVPSRNSPSKAFSAKNPNSPASGSYMDDAVILAALEKDKALWSSRHPPASAASPVAKKSAVAAQRQPPPRSPSPETDASISLPPPDPPTLLPPHAPPPSGWWYLHLFDKSQPDFNWQNADVAAEFEKTMMFWLQRGVDGFRIDVAPGLVKAKDYPDNLSDGNAHPARLLPLLKPLLPLVGDALPDHNMHHFDQPGVHKIYRKWRRFIDE